MDTTTSKCYGGELAPCFLTIFLIYIFLGHTLQWSFFTSNLTVSLVMAAILWNISESNKINAIQLKLTAFIPTLEIEEAQHNRTMKIRVNFNASDASNKWNLDRIVRAKSM